MNLVQHLTTQLQDTLLPAAERLRLTCALARARQREGSYEAAVETLGQLWHGVGVRPTLDGLDQETKAEVLLTVGVLSGGFGACRGVPDAQEASKDLLSESRALFAALGRDVRAAEAEIELAYCYRRAGAFDEARMLLRAVLERLPAAAADLRCLALLRLAIVEQNAQRPQEALTILRTSAALFEAATDDLLLGSFHNELAANLTLLAIAEDNPEYNDQALVEYAAAGHYFETCGHRRYLARVENNLGYLHAYAGRFELADEHLTRARDLFVMLDDGVSVAQVDETRARALTGAGRYAEAAQVAAGAVAAFERGDRHARLTEALTTLGLALARAGQVVEARATFERAARVGEQAGNPEGAGLALLTLLEEAGGQLTLPEFARLFERADDLLAGVHDRDLIWRLRLVARCAVEAVQLRAPAPPGGPDLPAGDAWQGFSLKNAVRRYEAQLIEQALRASDGEVTRAARLLGLSHQTFLNKLNQHHRDLLDARKPLRPRRKRIIKRPQTKP